MLFDEMQLAEIRHKIYYQEGYYVFKDFLSPERVSEIQGFWSDKAVAYEFHDFIKNRHVLPNCPPYQYHSPSDEDFAYCTHIWNQPIDEKLHEEMLHAQLIRNQIEGNALYHGLHESTGQALQYRVARTVSEGQVVKRHSDFFEEFRIDPAGSHIFDPMRLQIHLMLSTYGQDYAGEGFKFWNQEKTEYQVVGRDIEVGRGDLLLWQYTMPHEVSNVQILDANIGFMRVIGPLFDTIGAQA